MMTALNLPALLRPLAVATLALTLAGIAAARDNADGEQRPDGPPSPDQILERMQQNFGFNDVQRAQAKQILEQEHAKHEAAHKEAMQAISKLLTKDQQQKMQDRPPQGQQGDRKPGGGGNGGRDNSNNNNRNRGDRGGRDSGSAGNNGQDGGHGYP